MPYRVIHCYNRHYGILSPPFYLLSSTSFHIYPTMQQLQDFAVFPAALTRFFPRITLHSISSTLPIRPTSSIICSSHTNSQMLWMLCSVFCIQSKFPRYITISLCSPPWYLFWTILSLKRIEHLLIILSKVQLCTHEGTGFRWDRVNHDNYLYKLLNITVFTIIVFTYFINPQITPSLLRHIATSGLEGSHIAKLLFHHFWKTTYFRYGTDCFPDRLLNELI